MMESYFQLSNKLFFFKAKIHGPYFLVSPLALTTGLDASLHGFRHGGEKKTRSQDKDQ